MKVDNKAGGPSSVDEHFEAAVERANKGGDSKTKLRGWDKQTWENYLEGKPPLADADLKLDDKNILNVTDQWLSPSGDFFPLVQDLLLVKTNDGEFLVHPEFHPELYAQVKAKLESGKVEGAPKWAKAKLSDEHSDWLGDMSAQEYEVLGPDGKVPDFDELRYIGDGYIDHDSSVYFKSGFNLTVNGGGIFVGDGQAILETKDGKRFAVSKEYTPKAFAKLEMMDEVWTNLRKDINSGKYRVADPNEDIPVLGDKDKVKSRTLEDGTQVKGIKIIEREGKDDYVVIESETPMHYEVVAEIERANKLGKIDEVFVKHGLPTSEETGLMGQETTEEKEVDGKKVPLTVGEWYLNTLETKLKERKKDDKLKNTEETKNLEKYLDLLKLKDYIKDGGFEYLPYLTADTGHGKHTNYAQSTQGMDAADLRGLIDEEAVSRELADLVADDFISDLSQDLLEEGVGKLKDPEGLEKRLEDMLLGKGSAEYMKAIAELQETGLGEYAALRISDDLQLLNALDPDAAAEARDNLASQAMAMEYAAALKDVETDGGGDIADVAVRDMVQVALPGAFLAAFGIHLTDATLHAIFGKGDPAKLTPEEKKGFQLGKVMKESLTSVFGSKASSGDLTKPISSDELRAASDKAIGKLSLPDGEKKSLTQKIEGAWRKLMSSAVFPALGGYLHLSLGAYKLAGDGLADTWQERMGIARSFLVFLGNAPLGTVLLVDSFGTKAGQLFGTDSVVKALGLDKEVADLWAERKEKNDANKGGSGTSNVDEPNGSNERNGGGTASAGDSRISVDSFFKEIEVDPAYEVRPDGSNQNISGGAGVDKNSSIPTNRELDPDRIEVDAAYKDGKRRWIGAGGKLFTSTTNLAGGILDLVVAAVGLHGAIKSGDQGAINQMAISTASGVSFVGGGIAQILTNLGRGLKFLGPVGDLIGVGLAIGAMIYGELDRRSKNQKREEEIREKFERSEDYGVAEKYWGTNLNYLIHINYSAGKAFGPDVNSHPLYKEWFPKDLAAWDAQPEHYKKLTDEVKKNGSVNSSFFKDSADDLYLHVHGESFYNDNKEHIETIRAKWDDWNGRDDIVSKKDLEKIAKEASGVEKEAAEFLLNNEGFFDLLDILSLQQKKGDGKISDGDLDAWLKLIGEIETDGDEKILREKEEPRGWNWGMADGGKLDNPY